MPSKRLSTTCRVTVVRDPRQEVRPATIPAHPVPLVDRLNQDQILQRMLFVEPSWSECSKVVVECLRPEVGHLPREAVRAVVVVEVGDADVDRQAFGPSFLIGSNPAIRESARIPGCPG